MKIAVALGGKIALVAGSGTFVSKLEQALRDNGADVAAAAFADAESQLERVVAHHGRLDILVNVTGGDAEASTPATVERLCRKGAAAMGDRGGRIVNVTSVLGLVPVRGAGTLSGEAAAIVSLTRVLAMELGGRGVLVNGIAAGALDDDGGIGERMLSHIPVARKGLPDDIAGAVLFLVDPDNAYMTGHVLAVDGGWSAGYARDF